MFLNSFLSKVDWFCFNAFFCKTDLLDDYTLNSIDELYCSPQYGQIINGKHIGHPISNQKMLDV